MKPFFLLLLLIVSGILFELLFHSHDRIEALCQRLHRLPAHFKDMRRKTPPAAGLFGSLGRPLADEAWHPAMKF